MTGAVQQEDRVKSAVLAVLVAGALLLSASGSTLAAGKMGGAGGMDRSAYATATGDWVADVVDAPTSQGGKNGIEPGKS